MPDEAVADEYDRYLVEVASRLRRDWSEAEAAAYLVQIERDYMGLGVRADTAARAEAATREIAAYLRSIESRALPALEGVRADS